MLAPQAVDIAVTVSSLIASRHSVLHSDVRRSRLSTLDPRPSTKTYTLAEPFDDNFSLRQVKLYIGQRKYKQKFTTQGRK